MLLNQSNESNERGASKDFVCRYARVPYGLPQGVFRDHAGRSFIEDIRKQDLRLCMVKYEIQTGRQATCEWTTADIWRHRFESLDTPALKDYMVRTGVPAL